VPFLSSPDYLLLSQAAASAFAVGRLLHFRMQRQFSFLFSYLVFETLYCILLGILPGKSKAYFWVYLVSAPITWFLAAMSVREVFSLVFLKYPGLQTAGRWAVNVALALSLTICVLVLKTPFAGESSHTRWLFYEISFDRSLHFSLAVIILILLVFLSRYPLRLDRNTYIASGFFSAMFLAQSIVRLIDSLSPKLAVLYADYSEVAFTALCFVGWGIMVSPLDAPVPERRAPANPQREAELLQQLDALNNILGGSTRR
jgi:hypothetical protein